MLNDFLEIKGLKFVQLDLDVVYRVPKKLAEIVGFLLIPSDKYYVLHVESIPGYQVPGSPDAKSANGDDVPKLEPKRLDFRRVDKMARDLRRIYKENPTSLDVPTFAQNNISYTLHFLVGKL